MVADAIDYQQQGMIYRYTEDGELVDEFYVGIIPWSILLEVIGREEYEEKYIISAVCRMFFYTSIYNEWTTTQQRQ